MRHLLLATIASICLIGSASADPWRDDSRYSVWRQEGGPTLPRQHQWSQYVPPPQGRESAPVGPVELERYYDEQIMQPYLSRTAMKLRR